MQRSRVAIPWSLAWTLLVGFGCGGSDLALPGPGSTAAPAGIAIFKGNAQTGAPGTMLRDSIVVKVTDSTGSPMAGQPVEFAPVTSGAAVTPQTATTDADGLAGARWVLGPAAGPQEVIAHVMGGSDQLRVRFTASAETGSPAAFTLAVRTQPSASATTGVPFDRQPVVQLRDQSGADVGSSGVPVTAAVASGSGSLTGTTTRLTDDQGRAEFTDLRIGGATGSHMLIFAAAGYTSVTSNSIEVQPPVTTGNQPPSAVSDDYNTIEGFDHTLRVSAPGGVLQNDRDPEGGPLTASHASDPPHGKVTLEHDGSFSYTPDHDYFGDDRFTYSASDEAGNSSTATVTIHVAPVNDSPAFKDRGDPHSVKSDAGPQTVRDWATSVTPGADNESDQTLEFVVIGNSNPGLFTSGGQPAVTRNDPQSREATLTYTPSGQPGSATITVVLKDNGGRANGGGDSSAPHTFTIRVRS
jgi:Big-like domain-containing protein